MRNFALPLGLIPIQPIVFASQQMSQTRPCVRGKVVHESLRVGRGSPHSTIRSAHAIARLRPNSLPRASARSINVPSTSISAEARRSLRRSARSASRYIRTAAPRLSSFMTVLPSPRYQKTKPIEASQTLRRSPQRSRRKKRLRTVGRQALQTVSNQTFPKSGRRDSNTRRPAWERA